MNVGLLCYTCLCIKMALFLHVCATIEVCGYINEHIDLICLFMFDKSYNSVETFAFAALLC